jgi:lysophospholipase L1-like esterase
MIACADSCGGVWGVNQVMKRAGLSSTGEQPLTVVCFGDSNTHGASADDSDVRLPYSDRWTTHLQRMLGSGFLVIPEGLNGRTTVHDDPLDSDFVGVGGVNLNGRRYLLPCLHSHKPISTVVLGLGCNDLKNRFNVTAEEIRSSLRLLISDIRLSGSGIDGNAPEVVIVSPPQCVDTEQNQVWGFLGCAEKSLATIEAYRRECAEQGLAFVDLSAAAKVGRDGIHFTSKAAQPIAEQVVAAILKDGQPNAPKAKLQRKR